MTEDISTLPRGFVPVSAEDAAGWAQLPATPPAPPARPANLAPAATPKTISTLPDGFIPVSHEEAAGWGALPDNLSPPARPPQAELGLLNSQHRDETAAALKAAILGGGVVQFGDKFYAPGNPTPLGSVPSMTAEQGAAEKAARVADAQQKIEAASDPAKINQFMTPQEIAAQGEYAFDVPAETLKARQDAAVKAATADLAAIQQAAIPQQNQSTDLTNRALKGAGGAALDVAKPFGQAAAAFGAPGLQDRLQQEERALPPTDAIRDKDMSARVAAAGGGAAPYLALGAFGAGMRTMAIAGGLANAGGQVEAAQQADAAPPAQIAAGAGGFLVGMAQAAPVARLFQRALGPTGANALFNIGRQAAQGAAEFSAIQGAATLANNVIAKGLYDGDRDLMAGVRESAETAAFVGGLLGLGGAAFNHQTEAGRQKIAAAAEKFKWAETLDVSANASPEEVRAAYYKAAKAAHPDNGGSTEAMQAVNAAYEIYKAGQAKPQQAAQAKPNETAPSTDTAQQTAQIEPPGSRTFARGPSEAVSAAPPPTASPTPPAETAPARAAAPAGKAAEDAILRQVYDQDTIDSMSDGERAAELAAAKRAGVTAPATQPKGEPWSQSPPSTSLPSPSSSSPPSEPASLASSGRPGTSLEASTPSGSSTPISSSPPPSTTTEAPAPTALDTGKNAPETQATLDAQVKQLTSGQRKVMMFPRGTTPPERPIGVGMVQTARGEFWYDPDQIDSEDIKKASADGKENELLGLGPYSKPEIDARVAQGEKPVAVVERDQDGTELRTAYGTEQTAPEQIKAMEADKAPGATIAPEPVQQTIDDRAKKPAKPRPPQSMIAALRAAGGIRDQGGELKARDFHKRFPGLVNNRSGMNHDDARKFVAQRGYLGEPEHAVANTTVADYLNALDQHPRYSHFDLGRVAHMEHGKIIADERARALDDATQAILDDAGIGAQHFDTATLARAAELHVEHDVPIEHAFERAAIQSIESEPTAVRKDMYDIAEVPWEKSDGRKSRKPHPWDVEIAQSAAREAVGDGAATVGAGVEGNPPGAKGEAAGGRAEPASAGENPASQGSGGQGEGAGVKPPVKESLTTEPGAEGKPQGVIPGAEKITDAALAQKKADEKLKPKKPQAEGVGGMFDEAQTAPQLFDKPAKAPEPKSEPVSKADELPDSAPAITKHPQHAEAVEALRALGWKKAEAESFSTTANEQLGPGAKIETVIKKAIQNQRRASREDRPAPPRMPSYESAQLAPPFYSTVMRAIDKAKQTKASPDQWLATIKNTPGTKPEELDWLGLEPWLKSQTGAVTREQIADFVRANNIQVQEVEKGALFGPEPQKLAARKAEIDDKLDKISKREIAAGRIPAEAKDWKSLADEWYKIQQSLDEKSESRAPAKYASYTLPGGENYRELLLTLPAKEMDVTARAQQIADAENGPGSWARIGGGGQARYLNDARREERAGNYRSTHWDEPNIVAHVRFDERTGPNGERVLHLAEVQSDMHQEGRHKGYALPKNEVATLERRREELIGKGRDATTEEKQEWADIMNRLQANNKAVPSAPFKTTWPELALKRMIRYAAENGFDRLSWDTGATSADRYDLSKHVQTVQWSPDTESLMAWDHKSNLVVNKLGVKEADLPDAIGKEAAERLLAAEAKTQGRSPVRYHTLDGADLKMGGEGMTGFYDRMLPATANKLVKKFGAKVENSTVQAAESGENSVFHEAPDAPAHSIQITPALRNAALYEGFPLFQKQAGQSPISTASPKRLADVKKLVDDMVAQILPKDALNSSEIHDFIGMTPDELRAAGLNSNGARGANGAFDAYRRVIEISLQAKNLTRTMVHELWHATRVLGLATEKEDFVLQRSIPRFRRFLEKNFPQRDWSKEPDHEIEAYTVDAYEAMKEAGIEPDLHVGAKGIFSRFWDWLRKLWAKVRGKGEPITAESIFKDWREGGFRDREEGPSQVPGWEPGLRMPSMPPDDSHIFTDTSFTDRLKERAAAAREDLAPTIEENFLDVSARVRRLVGRLNGEAGPIPAAQDPYIAKRLLPGKTSARQADFQNDHVDPMLDFAKANRLSRVDIADFLYARHAPERNLAIEQMRPGVKDGSGRTDDQAQSVLDRLSAEGKLPALEKLGGMVDAMRAETISTLENSGLLSKAQAQAWRDKFKHYVPLKGFDSIAEALDHADGRAFGFGKKLSVRGPESKKTFGRRSISGDPFANIITDGFKAIERAERNEAGKVAWRLFKGLPPELLDGLVKLDKGDTVRALDEKTGLMVLKEKRPEASPENLLSIKIGGKSHHMNFADKKLAEAFNRLDGDQLVAALRPIGALINLYKSAWTHNNPEFMLRHFGIRYPMEGFFNAGEYGAGAMKRSFKSYPGGKMMRAVLEAKDFTTAQRRAIDAKVAAGTANETEKLQNYYHRARAVGMLMDFHAWSDMEGTKQTIDRALARFQGNPLKTALALARGAHQATDRFTSAMDNAQRLGFFIEAVEHGKSDEEAAFIARNATVDFSLRGKYSRYLNLMWPFANTGLQTASNVYRKQGRSAAFRKVLGGIVSFAAALTLFNYMFGGKDKDGKAFIEKVGEWQRRLNAVFMIPGTDDSTGAPLHLDLALPYTHAPFFALGAGMMKLALSMSDRVRGEKGATVGEPPGKILGEIMQAAFEGFVPVGQENSIGMLAVPEITRPLMHVYANKNFFGGPIHTPYPVKGLSAASQGFRNTSPFWKGLAQGINSATGGNEYESGFIDHYPEDYREVLGQISSSMERFGGNVMATGKSLAKGEKPEIGHIPFSRVFLNGGRADYDKSDRQTYFEMQREISAVAASMKKAVEARDPSAISEIQQRHGPEIQAEDIFKASETKRKELSAKIRAVDKSSLPSDQKDKLVKQYQDYQTRVEYDAVNRARKILEHQ